MKKTKWIITGVSSFLFAFSAWGQGVHCLQDLRREQGPYQELKITSQGTSYQVSVKTSAPGSSAAPTEKVLSALKCQFASADARVAICAKEGDRSENPDTGVSLRKVDVSALESLESRNLVRETFIEAEVFSPQINENEGSLQFPLSACKLI